MSFKEGCVRDYLLATGLIALLGGALGGCSSPLPEDNVLRGPARLVGLATTVGEPKDFVVASRRGEGNYIPIGVTPPEHKIKPKTPAELAAYENTLNQRRQRTQASATRAAPPFKPLQQPRVLPPIPGSELAPAAPGDQGEAPAAPRVQSP
jgi:hypothetical protein